MGAHKTSTNGEKPRRPLCPQGYRGTRATAHSAGSAHGRAVELAFRSARRRVPLGWGRNRKVFPQFPCGLERSWAFGHGPVDGHSALRQARRVRTRAVEMARSRFGTSLALLHVRYFSSQLVDGDDSALNERLCNGMNPPLVITQRAVGLCTKSLDVAAEFVHGHMAAVL